MLYYSIIDHFLVSECSAMDGRTDCCCDAPSREIV